MKIIDLPAGQKGEAWHQHRRDHDNASDAPAMMGCSPHETRSQLMHRIYLTRAGLPLPEFDDGTLARFEDGHRCEGLCRPLADGLVDDVFYPLVKANGRLSASLDGQTLTGETDWEHKLLNERLRGAIPASAGIAPTSVGANLPLDYRVQIAHQHHCSGADQTLFSASQWDRDGNLIEARHCWVERDEALIAQVLAGWVQFNIDLASYVPQAAAPVAVAAPMESLPAVSVRMDGKLAVISNLPVFGAALKAFIEKIPVKPSTDQEFADAKAACKALKNAEDALERAEEGALASIGDVEAMRRLVRDFFNLARDTRLAKEKMVTKRETEIKTEIVQGGIDALAAHIEALNRQCDARTNYLPAVPADFAGVIKNKRTVDSLRNAVDTELARAKIVANGWAEKITANLKTLADAGPEAQALFADRASLVVKDVEAVTAIVTQRVAEDKAAKERVLEAARETIRAEERAAAEKKVVDDALAADAAAQRERDTEALRQQQEQPAAQITTLLHTGPVPEPQPIGVHVGPPAVAMPAVTSSVDVIAARGLTVGPPVRDASLAVMDRPEPATISIGSIKTEIFGDKVGLTQAYITEVLKVPAHTEGAAVLYTPAQRRQIVLALIARLQGML